MKKIEIKKILVPTDFSETADLALEHACFMAKLFQADVYLVHIMSPYAYATPLPDFVVDNTLIEELKKRVQGTLDEKAREIYRAYGVKVNTILDVGNLVSGVVNLIKEIGVDIIVIGSHGASGFKELFIGSNAYRIVATSPVPVLTIQTHAKRVGFGRLFLPIDSSAFTREKVGPAVSLAEKYGAGIILYGELTKEHEEELKQMELRVKQAEAFIKEHGIPVKSLIEKVDNIAKSTYHKAKEMNADLIVVMTDQEPSNDLFLGPYTQQIIHRSKIPVLTIPTYAYREWFVSQNPPSTSIF